LNAIGLQPRDIDVVFLTHRDDDHVGGTVDAHGEPLYPKARYLMSRLEYEDFKTEAKRENQFQTCILPLECHGLLDLIEENAVVADGLIALPTPGHRPHATSLRVQDGDDVALLLADTLHLPVQVTHPEWSSVWDSDALEAAATRQWVIEQAQKNNWMLGIPHAPLGGLGRVRLEAGARVWSPL
jgi:glyoxylase-like metal-dependent hydrolase (beta-lactamase superfamily II)